MKNFEIVLILFLFILALYVYMYYKNEQFINFGPFKPVPESQELIDPLVCYPGTYWRNKSYQDICRPMSIKRPMRMDVEGKPSRLAEPRYEMVCNPDERGNRNCQMVKVYNRYF
jgi:hypothetical protein